MALTLDATAGSSDANTYVTLADAETVLEGYMPHITSSWDAALDAAKNEALVQATRDIDSVRLAGKKYYQGIENEDDYQALHFPTTDDGDEDSGLYIPEKVERATALQAAYLLRSGSAYQKTKDAMAAGIRSRDTGRFSEQIDIYRSRPVCSEALAQLSQWLVTSIRINRG